jgi:hypothetical protein
MSPSRRDRCHLRGVLVAVAVLVAGCGDSGRASEPTATTTPTPTATAVALDGCIEPGGAATISGDVATFGSGPVGVVTVSGPGGDACQWVELAEALAGRDMRVLVAGTGAGDDADEVERNLLQLRAERVVLVSTSAGATAALKAADGADRLVTLSAVRRFRGADALAIADTLSLPMLHLGSRGDPITNRGRDTRELRETGKAVITGGSAHGTDLLAEHPELIDRIAAFIGGGT